jgi:hypothetical membrane protein
MSTARQAAGGIAWMLTALYFAVQPVVIAAWRGDYDIRRHTISDLGVTECGVFTHLGGPQIPICSPRHDLMNATFIAVGLLIGLGTLLTRQAWPRSRTITAATWALMVTRWDGTPRIRSADHLADRRWNTGRHQRTPRPR